MENQDIAGKNTFLELVLVWFLFVLIVVYFAITAPFRFIKNKFLKK